jgi:hypothetical protein
MTLKAHGPHDRSAHRAHRAAPAAQASKQNGGASPDFGFNEWWYRDDIDVNQLAAMAQQAGSTVARVPVFWDSYQANPPDWSKLDQIVQAMRDHGMKPLLSAVGSVPAEGDPAFASFLKQLAQRYPDAKGIEVWNEPNLAQFGNIPPERYADLLTESVAAIHSVAPNMKVVSAGLSPAPGWQKYQQTVQQRAQGDYVVGVHPYARGSNDPHQLAQKTIDRFETADRLTGNHQLWVTEFGFSSGELSQKEQGHALAEAYQGLERDGAGVIIAHRLMDDPTYQPDSRWEQGTGLVESDGHKKKSFRILRHAIRG